MLMFIYKRMFGCLNDHRREEKQKCSRSVSELTEQKERGEGERV